MPQDSACPPWAGWQGADDFVLLQVAADPAQLVDKVRRSTGILASRASAQGMELTYATDKTAALFSAGCPLDPGTTDDGWKWTAIHGHGKRVRTSVSASIRDAGSKRK